MAITSQALIIDRSNCHLENCITTPTRGENTLDLCFTNNHSIINFYRTIFNKSFSDHNTLEFDLNFSYNTEKKKEKKKNPYETKVPEYDTENADDEEWLRFQKALDKVDVDKDLVAMKIHTQISINKTCESEN